MRHTAILAAITLLCLAPLATAGDPAPAEKTGLKVGENAPAFKLKDQTGRQRTLEDLVEGANYIAVVFHRSANW